MKDYQSQLNEAAAEEAQEREEAIDRAMAKLGLDPEDEGAYVALGVLYDEAYDSGNTWEYRFPS